jgi:hypothetical protein
MQHDDPCRIAMLLDSPNRYAVAFCAFPQPCQKLEPFVLAPRERIVSGDCMEDVEPGPAHTSNAERSVKGVAAGLREINRTQDLLDRCHRCILIL